MRLASPIFTLALAMPMVRMTRPIGPFSRAKTCSMKARTFDFLPLALAMASGIGLPLGFLRWIWLRKPLSSKSASFLAER